MTRTNVNVSMRDVAAKAGVSLGTVSNVLNSPQKVAPATQMRVNQAIDELGWVRNETARQLRAGTSNTIGMIVLDIANPYFADLLRGAECHLYDQRYAVNVGNLGQLPMRENILIRHFIEGRVKGVLLALAGAPGEDAESLRDAGIPVVLLDCGNAQGYCGVGVDDMKGGSLAIEHLAHLGHQTIAVVGGNSGLAQVRDRLIGAEQAAQSERSSLELQRIESTTLSIDAGLAAAREIVKLAPTVRPTAVFALNDLVAIGLLQGLVGAGLRVPSDIAIVGYDDIEFAAAAAVPLTSVRQPRLEMGKCAAELLLNEIEARDLDIQHEHISMRFLPQLIARSSTEG